MSNPKKLQRWVDILAALLKRSPLTFEEVALAVPQYDVRKKPKATVKRMFERDKKELLEAGIPIESLGELGDEDSRYRLQVKDFYLPYLAAVTPQGTTVPRKAGFGYGGLDELTFDAEELRAITEAAEYGDDLGSQPLADDIDSAMRKLRYDLPLDSVGASNDVHVLRPTVTDQAKTLLLLGEALHARRRVRFEYHALGARGVSKRVVDPYGLLFLNAHWYLVARDTEKDALRNFRVNRIRSARVLSADKERPDYEIPSDFRLRDHARSRQSWELGDADAFDVVVRFNNPAVVQLGEVDASAPGCRRFSVRRPDRFVRWLFSFAGEAIPISPDSIVDDFRRQALAVGELYAGDAARASGVDR